jgi:hypothetical protein
MEWPAPPSGKVVSPEAQTEEWIMKIAVSFSAKTATPTEATMRRATSFPLLDLL